ncbi:MAG: hypothetical protein GQE15_37650 [Archangiaceae bacterium]|nr:hypothetical protein [Archangiaceae bacterium]
MRVLLVLMFSLAGCRLSDAGLPCSASTPCPSGATCDLTLAGGTCTFPCPNPVIGVTCGGPDVFDATCAAYDGRLLCAQNCTQFVTCRAGLTCREFDGGVVKADAGGFFGGCLP